MNEADVREEGFALLLRRLSHGTGMVYNHIREQSLSLRFLRSYIVRKGEHKNLLRQSNN